MTQFSVDVASVQDLGARLRGLKQEFEGLEGDMEATAAVLGSSEVADALEAFASNWSDKRRQTVRELDEVAGYAVAAAGAYAACEAELSSHMEAPPADGPRRGG